jgi:hypothetical protein
MKIFNKSRFKLLKGKGISKYLFYAIGEIILVVIGILIALWLNNWNKEQQVKQTNKNLQQKVLAQLERDINDISNFRLELDSLDHLYLKALKRDYDKSKIEKGGLLTTVLFEVKDLGLNKQNVNWIDSAELDNSNASQSLINLSSVYKLYYKNIDDIENIIYKKLTSNLEVLEKTQDWYTDLITDFNCNNDCVQFLRLDEGHKSRIASLRFLYIYNYGDLAKGFYYDLKRSKTRLENLINDSD